MYFNFPLTMRKGYTKLLKPFLYYSINNVYLFIFYLILYIAFRASVVRGRIISGRGAGLVGVRVSHFRPKDTGFTLSRQGGWFDLMKVRENKSIQL
ncbi:hypothetical protein Anas_03353 [Armadillidium nasatum]|uniref:Teneurin TTR-like domain-containing protein n=1 Tax=Armadillidium nasatum TaxID=96803 RepID=A0A5N5TJK1_9CRUS|nr:hypothetical protein Anas_03353 [Armadillidium nasatum]